MLNLATKKKQPLHDFIILQHNFHDYQWSMAKKISSVPHLKLKMTDLAVLELRKNITSCEIQLKSEENS